MTAVVSVSADVQYNIMTGTVALDTADFETYEEVLELPPGWIVLGFSLYASHTSLGIEGKPHATSSLMSLHTWAVPLADVTASGDGLTGYLRQRPVPVAQFNIDIDEADYPSPLDPMSIVLRGAKRLNLVVWNRTVSDADIEPGDFAVRERWARLGLAGEWVAEDAG